MAQNKKKKTSGKAQKKTAENAHQSTKTWQRIGALVIVLALIISMIAMYMSY
jgi:flagellar biogenesis protein FliO